MMASARFAREASGGLKSVRSPGNSILSPASRWKGSSAFRRFQRRTVLPPSSLFYLMAKFFPVRMRFLKYCCDFRAGSGWKKFFDCNFSFVFHLLFTNGLRAIVIFFPVFFLLIKNNYLILQIIMGNHSCFLTK